MRIVALMLILFAVSPLGLAAEKTFSPLPKLPAVANQSEHYGLLYKEDGPKDHDWTLQETTQIGHKSTKYPHARCQLSGRYRTCF